MRIEYEVEKCVDKIKDGILIGRGRERKWASDEKGVD